MRSLECLLNLKQPEALEIARRVRRRRRLDVAAKTARRQLRRRHLRGRVARPALTAAALPQVRHVGLRAQAGVAAGHHARVVGPRGHHRAAVWRQGVVDARHRKGARGYASGALSAAVRVLRGLQEDVLVWADPMRVGRFMNINFYNK